MKSKKMKVLCVVGAVVLAGSLSFGFVASTGAKVTLRIFSGDMIFAKTLATTVAKRYEKEMGVKVIVETFPYSSCHEKTMIELASGSSSYDLFLCDCIWCGEVMGSGCVWNIEGFMADPDLPKLNLENLSRYSDPYNTYQGKRYGLVVSENSPELVYRKDLFEEYGIPYPTKSWDGFQEAAKKLTLDRNGDGRIDVYGAVLLEQEQDAGYSEWTFRLIGFNPFEDGKYIFNNKAEPIFNTPKGIKALKMLRDVMPYCPPDTLAYGYGEACTAYKQGKIATVTTWQDMLKDMEDPQFSEVAGKNGYTMIPYVEFDRPYGGIAGGWNMFINKASRNPKEAYKFMAWMTEGYAYQAFAEEGEPGVTYLPIRNDPKWQEKMPFLKPWQEFPGVITIPCQYPEFTEVQRLIWEEIADYLAGKKSVEVAVKNAETKVYNLMERAGYYK